MKESAPENKKEKIIKFNSEENVFKWYRDVLKSLRGGGFEVTPVEAVFLRQTIRDIFNENEKIQKSSEKSGKESMDLSWTYPEIFIRFFWHCYGVNLQQYYRNIDLMKDKDNEKQDECYKKQKQDLYKYVQEKLRKDQELI